MKCRLHLQRYECCKNACLGSSLFCGKLFLRGMQCSSCVSLAALRRGGLLLCLIQLSAKVLDLGSTCFDPPLCVLLELAMLCLRATLPSLSPLAPHVSRDIQLLVNC